MASKRSVLTQEHWLRRLEWALHALPAKDRAEIAREAHSHIEDRLAQGHALADVLASLGTPEEHARGFYEEFELSEALGSRATPRMLRVAAQRVHQSAAAALALFLVFIFGLLGSTVMLTALMHFIDPRHWGVWVSSHFFIIGGAGEREGAHELLDVWIYPMAAATAFGCWHAGRASLLWALRTMARR